MQQATEAPVRVTVHRSVRELGRAGWDALATAADAPVFYSYDFLDSIERAPLTAGAEPYYLVARRQGRAVAALPVYRQETADPFDPGPAAPVRQLYGHFWHCYDGDGAVLMHAGTLSTIGHFGPPNLTHVVFDNGSYESTGGQPTAATGTDLAGVALASGYRHARRVRTMAELRSALDFARSVAGPTAVVVAGGTGGPAGDRASSSVDVPRLARRFARSLGADLPEPAR